MDTINTMNNKINIKFELLLACINRCLDSSIKLNNNSINNDSSLNNNSINNTNSNSVNNDSSLIDDFDDFLEDVDGIDVDIIPNILLKKKNIAEDLFAQLNQLLDEFNINSTEFLLGDNQSIDFYNMLTCSGIINGLDNIKLAIKKIGYLSVNDEKIFTNNKINIKNDNIISEMCNDCNIKMDVYHEKSIVMCPNCGLVEKILNPSFYDNNHFKAKDKSYNIGSVTNNQETIKHYNKWINMLLANDNTKVTDENIDKIRKKCNIEKYNINRLNIENMRIILKELKLSDYNNYCPYIIRKLQNKTALNIPYKYQMELKRVFVKFFKVYFNVYKTKNLKYYPAFIGRIIKSNYFRNTPLKLILPNIHKQSQQTENKTTEIWNTICRRPELKFIQNDIFY